MFRHHLVHVAELADGPKKIEFFGRTVHVAQVNDRVLAFADSCTHIGGPLEFKDGQYQCAWHAACFDEEGHRTKGPASPTSRLMRVPIEVVDGRVEYVWSG